MNCRVQRLAGFSEEFLGTGSVPGASTDMAIALVRGRSRRKRVELWLAGIFEEFEKHSGRFLLNAQALCPYGAYM